MVERIKEAHERLQSEIKKQLKSSIIYTGKKHLIDGLTYYRGDIICHDKLVVIDVDDIVDYIITKHDVALFDPDNFGDLTRKAMVGMFKMRARELIEDLNVIQTLSYK